VISYVVCTDFVTQDNVASVHHYCVCVDVKQCSSVVTVVLYCLLVLMKTINLVDIFYVAVAVSTVELTQPCA